MACSGERNGGRCFCGSKQGTRCPMRRAARRGDSVQAALVLDHLRWGKWNWKRRWKDWVRVWNRKVWLTFVTRVNRTEDANQCVLVGGGGKRAIGEAQCQTGHLRLVDRDSVWSDVHWSWSERWNWWSWVSSLNSCGCIAVLKERSRSVFSQDHRGRGRQRGARQIEQLHTAQLWRDGHKAADLPDRKRTVSRLL